MRIKERRPKLLEINLTPMIDCVFLLNLFFMLVTDMSRQDDIEEIRLPDIKMAVPDEHVEPTRLVLVIRRDGVVFVSGRPYDLNTLRGAKHINDLLAVEARLSGRTGTGVANRLVLLRADERTPFKHIRKIMTMCVDRHIGIWRLAFGTLPFQTREQKELMTSPKAPAGT
jgi:biopolymer transport protein ExbD